MEFALLFLFFDACLLLSKLRDELSAPPPPSFGPIPLDAGEDLSPSLERTEKVGGNGRDRHLRFEDLYKRPRTRWTEVASEIAKGRERRKRSRPENRSRIRLCDILLPRAPELLQIHIARRHDVSSSAANVNRAAALSHENAKRGIGFRDLEAVPSAISHPSSEHL